MANRPRQSEGVDRSPPVYIDEENELVVFSSDNELIEALTQSKGGFFRVYVKVVSKKDSNESGAAKVHPLVTCDGCEGNVVGSRFKCSVCPDYDLCGTCEVKGLHSQHPLLRIRNPGPSSFIPPCPPWFMPWMHGMGPRGWCGPGRGGPVNRGSPFHGGRRGGGCPRFPGPEQSSHSRSERSGEGAEFFHQFGEALNSVLGPFGVDVHTYTEKSPESCGQHEDAKSPDVGQATKDKDSDEPMDEACSSHDGDHTYVVVDGAAKNDKSPGSQGKLENALDHMKAMGFNDDGGWLTQLLKAKDCNINKVLDAIQHPERKA